MEFHLRKSAKDTDHTDVLIVLYSLPYALIFGVLAFGTSTFVAKIPWYISLVIGAVVFVGILFLPSKIVNASGDAVASIYAPTGNTTPPLREYSLAESLVVRGLYDDAADAYGLLADDFPNDPEPPLRYARLLRDKMMRYEDAAAWYKRALSVEGIQEATEVATMRELIELYTHKLRTPARALPYLAQLPQKYPANPAAAWARKEYLEIKEAMKEAPDV